MNIYLYDIDTGDGIQTEKAFRHKADAKLYKQKMGEYNGMTSEMPLEESCPDKFIYKMKVNTDDRIEEFDCNGAGDIEPSWIMKLRRQISGCRYPKNSRMVTEKGKYGTWGYAEFPRLHIKLSATSVDEAKREGLAIYKQVRLSDNWENLITETGFNIKDFPRFEVAKQCP